MESTWKLSQLATLMVKIARQGVMHAPPPPMPRWNHHQHAMDCNLSCPHKRTMSSFESKGMPVGHAVLGDMYTLLCLA